MSGELHHDLLRQARHLASVDPTRPKQASLRRAVSTAYYAMFHFLIDQSCRSLVGGRDEDRPIREMLSRAYAHDEMLAAAQAFRSGMQGLSPGIQRAIGSASPFPADLATLADLFKIAQEERHRADYDLSQTFVRSEVLWHVERIENALGSWNGIKTTRAAHVFLISLAVHKRLKSR
jgi:hypothetical protein